MVVHVYISVISAHPTLFDPPSRHQTRHASTANESIQLLQEVLDRSVQVSTADELMESLFNSCKYRKQKISAVIGIYAIVLLIHMPD